MVILDKGEYQGEINRSLPAGEVLVGLTSYHKEINISTLHSHRNAHFSFVLSGTMQVRRKTLLSDKTTIEWMSFMRAGEIHQNTLLSQACRNVNVELEAGFFDKYNLEQEEIARVINKKLPAGGLLMSRLYKEVILHDESFMESVHMLLVDAMSEWQRSESSIPDWLLQVRDLLHDRWQDNVGLADIAHEVGVHPVNVSRYFLRHFGCSLGEYKRKLKVERAIQMIVSTDMLLTEITFICGFFDQSHFIRVFKEHSGLLPKQLRSQR